jgi:RNA polymerase sigma-70 factor (ECF subfamily)
VSTSGAAAETVDLSEVESFEALYRVHERRIFGLCLLILHSREDAEDATQETFLRASRHLDRLSGDPAGYLTVIARHVCTDTFRLRASRERSLCKVGIDTDACDPEHTILHRFALEGVWGKLSTHERRLVAHTFAGYSHRDVADRVGVSMKSVSVGMFRLRKRVRQYAEAIPALAPIPALRDLGAGLLERLRLLARRAGRDDRCAAAVSNSVSFLVAGLGAVVLATVITGIRPEAATAQADAMSSARIVTPADRAPSSVRPGAGATARRRPTSTSPSSPGRPTPQQAFDYLVGGILTPGAKASQQDGLFTDLSPSPAYGRDGTIYAYGILVKGCLRPPCPLLFASTDRGATWSRRNASGFLGGRLLVAETSPGEQLLFASTSAGLQRSDDGGKSFTTATPTRGPAAPAPAPDTVNDSILIASNPMWWYSITSGQLSPGPSLPVGTGIPDDVAFGVDRNHVVVATSGPDPHASSLEDGQIVDCEPPAGCRVVLSEPDTWPIRLSPSPTVADDHTIFASGAHKLFVSHDGGRSFLAANVDLPGLMTAVGIDPRFASNGVVELGFVREVAKPSPNLLGSFNGGMSFVALPGVGLPESHSIASLLQLPDGRLLGALNGADDSGFFGIRCSLDRGGSWKAGC